MLGLLAWREIKRGRCRIETEAAEPLGLACVVVTLTAPQRAGPRRRERLLERTAAALRTLGVRRLIFSPDFPYKDFFLARGLREADCTALLTAKGPELLTAASPRHERVLLSAAGSGRGEIRALRELCRSFRYVILETPGEARGLERVCGDFGVTPERLPRDRVAEADAALFLAALRGPVFLPERCRTLTVSGDRRNVLGGRELEHIRFTLPERLRFGLPFPGAPLLSAAVEAGRISPEQVKILHAPLTKAGEINIIDGLMRTIPPKE